MRRFVDLHVHSTASDGAMAPREVVRLADAKRLAAIALTDHDTTAGLAEAAREAALLPKLRFVPGVEMSALFPRGTMHILGLGIDENSPAIHSMLTSLRAARDERNPKIVAKLQAMGMDIDMDDVLAAARGRAARRVAAGGSIPSRVFAERDVSQFPGHAFPRGRVKAWRPEWTIGRVHIAEALRRKGCVATITEAFQWYIGQGGPAFVDKERVAPRDVIRAVLDSGGAAVLAHPVQLRCENLRQLERIVRELIAHGLSAIEVFHSDHTETQTRHYLKLAQRLGLGVSGGSDFHGAPKPEVVLGRPAIPLAAITGCLKAIVAAG